MSAGARTTSSSTDRDPAGWGLGAVSAVVLLALSWWRHRGYWTGFDLAIFDQAAWQVSEGRAHISIVERHVLADHLSPVLYLFGAMYRAHASVGWLFGAQAAALGAAVPAMRRMAGRVGASPRVAALLTMGSAPMLSAALFDFHPATLAVPFIAWGLVFALEGRVGPVLLMVLGVAVCRADLALVVAGIALVAQRRVRWALLPAVGGMALAAAVVPGWFGPTNGWEPHFGHMGESPLAATVRPWEPLSHLLAPGSLTILVLWLVAAGCVGVLAPRWTIALVIAGLPVLLSRWVGTELPWYHYGAPMAPIAIGGALQAASTLDARSERWRQVLLLSPFLALLVASPLAPGAPEQNRVWSFLGGNDRHSIDAVITEVEPNEAVSAEQWLLPHIAHREELYLFPIPFEDAPAFFAPGSGPDLASYPPDAVDLVITTEGWVEIVPRDFAVVERNEDWVAMRRSGDE